MTQILVCTIKTERGHSNLSRRSFFFHFKMETKRMSTMRLNPSFVFAESESSEIFEISPRRQYATKLITVQVINRANSQERLRM